MNSLTPAVRADAVPYFYHVQESFPYFTNRIADNRITDDGSEDVDLDNPLVIMRFVVAHLTEGYRGEPEGKLYTWLPTIKTYFNEHMWLQSAAYPDRMDNLQSARIVNGGSVRPMQNDGVGAIQIAAEIQLQCIFYESLEQDSY
jgi:hypothetical protein